MITHLCSTEIPLLCSMYISKRRQCLLFKQHHYRMAKADKDTGKNVFSTYVV